MVIVSISRQAASRGDVVARRTAETLGRPLINPEVVARAALRLGLQREDLSVAERAGRLGERLALIALDLADEPADNPDWALHPLPSMLTNPGYRTVIETMVMRLVAGPPIVLAGYPAQALVRGSGADVHAFVVAPLATRVQRMVLREDIPIALAERVVRDSDRDRRDFYRRLYDLQWDDPTLYDCVVNTARLTIEEAAESVITILRGLLGAGR